MRRFIYAALALTSALCFGFFGWAWYTRYFVHRDCFNEQGRCYDPHAQIVYLEQAGIAWSSMATIAVILCVFFMTKAKRKNVSR